MQRESDSVKTKRTGEVIGRAVNGRNRQNKESDYIFAESAGKLMVRFVAEIGLRHLSHSCIVKSKQ
jgi:hypothetical protein